jgi:hypothetical protein
LGGGETKRRRRRRKQTLREVVAAILSKSCRLRSADLLLASGLELLGVVVDEVCYVRVVAELSLTDLQPRLVVHSRDLTGVLGAAPLALGRDVCVLGEVLQAGLALFTLFCSQTPIDYVQ